MVVPESEAARTYLGLEASRDRFVLEDIQSELLVVDCFDMYCHSCQTGAKHVNELYAMVQEHGLADRIKFIGLGINNTPLETATFRRKFDVPFPSFPDRRRDISNQFGRVRLPSILVLRFRLGRWEVMHRTTGAFCGSWKMSGQTRRCRVLSRSRAPPARRRAARPQGSLKQSIDRGGCAGVCSGQLRFEA